MLLSSVPLDLFFLCNLCGLLGWHIEWYCWEFHIFSHFFSSEKLDLENGAIFFVCFETMLSFEYVMKRECSETRCWFLWKLFSSVRYNSLMILFENAEKYSNTPFWFIINPHFPSDFSLWEPARISFSFGWFFLIYSLAFW